MMRKLLSVDCVVPIVALSAVLVGCNKSPSGPENKSDASQAQAGAEAPSAEIVAALAELSDEDRPLAQAQKYCAVEHKNLLGSMGKPHKLMIEGKAVFLCCEGCTEDAMKDPQKTLANVEELKAK